MKFVHDASAPMRRPCLGLTLAFTGLLVASTLARVDAAPRKSHHPVPAPTARDIEPETTGTIPVRPPPRPATPAPSAPSEETLPPPFHLPSASRARMRECGQKWQAMKMSGEAGDDIWRSFATRCLAATNGPQDKRSDR